MLILLYLAVLIPAAYWVVKTLAPEMAKPPVTKPSVRKNSFEPSQADEADKRIEKLEILLSEKNKNIQLLQKELKITYSQIRNFDKIKTLLLGEIHRLREQNRMFRSELGLPTIQQPRENSIA